ncbi:NgoMIV family type II restriction endonuclease [Actinobaculum sp. 313]|uniref:NgoMIV family type II restriction endonuclease n=1 Tax=Actinobaculum sp. 313 TaxID=2495645 RepID=UPI000D5266AC|nr:NgoMIV family type II restriction endonuclease [Actinobaculum sp. 313]AWE41733.1 restriction endonuclease [Actinobaculum sp. 313]
MSSILTQARTLFHQTLVDSGTLIIDNNGIASNADRSQETSRKIALSIARKLRAREVARRLNGQTTGGNFENAVSEFLRSSFPRFAPLRPGAWRIENVGARRGEYHLARFEPYTHLDDLANAIEKDNTLRAVLGNSYAISPDVLVIRDPEPDDHINIGEHLVDEDSGLHAPIRAMNNTHGILHAVVSCKWTLRSDRAQNARSEALSLIRNRKGRTPHIAVVTAEPTPSRLASLALGTGDVDCVYHFALPELIAAVEQSGNDEAQSMLNSLLDGKRLRDISDLVLDLTV